MRNKVEFSENITVFSIYNIAGKKKNIKLNYLLIFCMNALSGAQYDKYDVRAIKWGENAMAVNL